MNLCPKVLYSLGCGSWLAVVTHYAAIHCLHQRTIGPAVCSKQTYHHHARPSPRACKVLLISHPTESRKLSWPEHTCKFMARGKDQVITWKLRLAPTQAGRCEQYAQSCYLVADLELNQGSFHVLAHRNVINQPKACISLNWYCFDNFWLQSSIIK